MEQLDTPRSAGDGGPPQQNLLYTPAEAASILAVKESWLRRSAGQRRIPCTFLGKHLRFSRSDLQGIVASAHRPARPPTRTRRT
ncbi:helix-turn-helix domain-containing protein [Actinokineospora sp. NPDC004072]